MALPHHNDMFCWYDSLADVKPHYTPIPVKTWLQFFILKPRASVIAKANLIPYDDVAYCYKVPTEEKYYVKRYRNYDYEEMQTISSAEVHILRARIDAGQVWLLLTLHNIADMTDMLKRIYKAHFKTEGKVDYPLYLRLLDASLQYEDYREVGRNLVGFKTASNQMEIAIANMWQEAKK